MTLTALSGCTNAQLRRTTVAQASTLTDLQYQMVLENLAMFAANPGSMPWHVNIAGGASQVTDTGTGRFNWTFNTPSSVRDILTQNLAPGGSASRTIVQQWAHTPVTDGDELRLLRVAYRRACGSPEMPDKDLLDDLAYEIKDLVVVTEDLRAESWLFHQSASTRKGFGLDPRRDNSERPDGPGDSPLAREVAHRVGEIVEELGQIRPGWYGSGGRRDVPKTARYVAHDGDTYVWVCPSGIEGLTQFTLSILEMASALHPPALNSAANTGVAFSPGFTAPQ